MIYIVQYLNDLDLIQIQEEFSDFRKASDSIKIFLERNRNNSIKVFSIITDEYKYDSHN